MFNRAMHEMRPNAQITQNALKRAECERDLLEDENGGIWCLGVFSPNSVFLWKKHFLRIFPKFEPSGFRSFLNFLFHLLNCWSIVDKVQGNFKPHFYLKNVGVQSQAAAQKTFSKNSKKIMFLINLNKLLL